MNALPKEAQLRREASPAERIPYVAHVSPQLVKTALRRLRAGIACRRGEL